MKKKKIIKLIQLKRVIEQHQDLLSTIKVRQLGIEEDEKYWYPNIPELKEYFEILKKEILQAKKETLESEKAIQEINCFHDVRLRYNGLFSSYCRCVLCGERISSDNTICFKESNYRNKHTVTFESKYQCDSEGEPYEVKEGKTELEVQKIILEILKNFQDEDEVDLVEEFSKLKFKKMEINKEKRKKEKYILIIGGTNKELINKEDNVYLSKETQNTSLDFLNYFISLLNIKVVVIDRKETLNVQEFQEIRKTNHNVLLDSYTSLGYLETALNQVEDVAFQLIIDLSELYNYEIIDNKVKSEVHDLRLNEKFPNSQIIKIKSNNERYYIEGNTEKSFEETCNDLKRMLKK